ncbi:hypothetical protein PMAYCL1PPCAC_08007, partial [Pristionchus mayeri]
IRSLFICSLLLVSAHCLTCSTSAIVSNAMNTTGSLFNSSQINLNFVSCPATLDRCMRFNPMSIAEVLALDGAKQQVNFTTPLNAFKNGTLTGFVCASQNDCTTIKATNLTSCSNTTGNCCCSSDLCTTKHSIAPFSLGSLVILLISAAMSI